MLYGGIGVIVLAILSYLIFGSGQTQTIGKAEREVAPSPAVALKGE
jgi:hypothetical protein